MTRSMTDAKGRRDRGEAYTGAGYGSLRRHLQQHARDQIELSLSNGFFCEAIALCESIIADRLESRLSFLCRENSGFRTLGGFGELWKLETDPTLKKIYADIKRWTAERNSALHEMVKVEAGKPLSGWDERVLRIKTAAGEGYELAKRIYHAVADQNPRHRDRVLPRPRHGPGALVSP